MDKREDGLVSRAGALGGRALKLKSGAETCRSSGVVSTLVGGFARGVEQQQALTGWIGCAGELGDSVLSEQHGQTSRVFKGVESIVFA